jgi:hypothetical protein
VADGRVKMVDIGEEEGRASSTAVRRAVAGGRGLDKLCVDVIVRYIQEQGLYIGK